MAKAVRPGKVFVDWSQNNRHKTTVAVYSLRARPRPTVSTPVTWDEVAACADGGDDLVFEAADVLARVDELGDLFAPGAHDRAGAARLAKAGHGRRVRGSGRLGAAGSAARVRPMTPAAPQARAGRRPSSARSRRSASPIVGAADRPWPAWPRTVGAGRGSRMPSGLAGARARRTPRCGRTWRRRAGRRAPRIGAAGTSLAKALRQERLRPSADAVAARHRRRPGRARLAMPVGQRAEARDRRRARAGRAPSTKPRELASEMADATT